MCVYNLVCDIVSVCNCDIHNAYNHVTLNDTSYVPPMTPRLGVARTAVAPFQTRTPCKCALQRSELNTVGHNAGVR